MAYIKLMNGTDTLAGQITIENFNGVLYPVVRMSDYATALCLNLPTKLFTIKEDKIEELKEKLLNGVKEWLISDFEERAGICRLKAMSGETVVASTYASGTTIDIYDDLAGHIYHRAEIDSIGIYHNNELPIQRG